MLYFLVSKLKNIAESICSCNQQDDEEARNFSISHRNLINRVNDLEGRINEIESETEDKKVSKTTTYLKFKRKESSKRNY